MLTSRRNSFKESMLLKENKIGQRMTPIITSLYDRNLTEFDMKNYIENGVRIIRFKSTTLTNGDKILLLNNLKTAIQCCCLKYEISFWPIAICVDIPNCSIYTGLLSDEILSSTIHIEKNSIVEVTSDVKFYSKCDAKRIFITDPYTLPTIPIGTEINFSLGKIIMICIEIVNNTTIKCKVIKEGLIHSQMKVCIRGVKLLKPPLSEKDLDVIEFAKVNKCDVIIVNAVRLPQTIYKIRSLLKGSYKPLLLSAIYEQEGLDNVNEIIDASDGLILAREFLSWSIIKTDQILKTQLHLGAICKMKGKPFFISGNILISSIVNGKLMESDLSDISMAMKQGAGFLLRTYNDPAHVNAVFQYIKDICMDVDPIIMETGHLWNMPYQMPINAAEACIHSSVALAKVAEAKAIIVLTVTGKTVKQLSSMCENIFIIAVTTSPVIARQLMLYRGVISIIYDTEAEKNWKNETDSRVKFGAACAMKFEVLKYACPFVVLNKRSSSSSYCDQVSIWKVTEEEQTKLQNKIKMPGFAVAP